MSRAKLKTKRLADYPQHIRDCLAVWSAFRQLGFSADEIFFGFGPVSGNENIVHMQLQTQGKDFTVVVAQLPNQEKRQVEKLWLQAATLATKRPVEEMEVIFRQHLLGSNTDYFRLFGAEIMKKGILLPAVVEMMPHAGKA